MVSYYSGSWDLYSGFMHGEELPTKNMVCYLREFGDRMKIVFFLEDKHSQACTSLSLIIIVKQSRLCLSKSGFLASFRREYKRGYHLQNPKPMRVAVNA